ncbi:retinol dehydrogenase 12 [Lophiotrema nucula]|uniref:Retinol dehydrogenase 12 n=1 Tax=Lophiotrema nucula TaxID=690887 RepID=A0A6A5ZDZ3_9PLEO|nr:retinol dehydrogenase 12 [Lophiotrema nucula]
MTSYPSYNNETSGLEVARTFSAQANGKTVLITGVSPGGIGDALARAFAYGGASIIIITGRNDERLAEETASLRTTYPSTSFRPLKLSLDSLEATSASANELIGDDSIPQIDIIIANAGFHSFATQRTVTADGLESHFGANYLAHFYLISLLLPKLRASIKSNASTPGATRIITMSSMATHVSPIRFSDWNFEGKPLAENENPNWAFLKNIGIDEHEGYDGNVAYAQSKTAKVLLALELSKRLSSEGIFSFAVNPGVVMSTAAINNLPKLPEKLREGLLSVSATKNIDQGCATAIVAALDPKLTPGAGIFLADCQFAEAPSWATHAESAERLWELSEGLLKEKLGA